MNLTKKLLMKKCILYFILILALFSCKEEDEQHAGAKGTIQIGEGGCAPPIDYSSRYYYNYNGYAYFIPSVYIDSLSSISLTQLKHSSDSTAVVNGSFTVALEPGTYMVRPLQEITLSKIHDFF